MASSSSFVKILLAVCLMSALVISTVSASGEYYEAAAAASTQMGWMMPMRSGLIGEDEEFEFQLDSESNRRILATQRYISYGALQRNSIPCSRRGQSYYNCRPGAPANPYSRGCNAITRCRS